MEMSNFIYYFFVLFDPNFGVLLHRTRAVPVLKLDLSIINYKLYSILNIMMEVSNFVVLSTNPK